MPRSTPARPKPGATRAGVLLVLVAWVVLGILLALALRAVFSEASFWLIPIVALVVARAIAPSLLWLVGQRRRDF